LKKAAQKLFWGLRQRNRHGPKEQKAASSRENPPHLRRINFLQVLHAPPLLAAFFEDSS
jgi:hypothetical protein